MQRERLRFAQVASYFNDGRHFPLHAGETACYAVGLGYEGRGLGRSVEMGRPDKGRGWRGGRDLLRESGTEPPGVDEAVTRTTFFSTNPTCAARPLPFTHLSVGRHAC